MAKSNIFISNSTSLLRLYYTNIALDIIDYRSLSKAYRYLLVYLNSLVFFVRFIRGLVISPKFLIKRR